MIHYLSLMSLLATRKRNGQFGKGHGQIDLTAKRYGRWLVSALAWRTGEDIFWRCICNCGNKRSVSGHSLRSNRSKSCGCLHRELSRQRKKHGLSRSRIYHVWADMRQRCENIKHPSFRDYGGRGITVCRRWQSFPHFSSDMGPRPHGSAIERINNQDGYNPSNCMWASRKQQQRNRRGNRVLRINGQSKCVAEWSEISGVSSATIFSRLHKLKWKAKRAVFAPVRGTIRWFPDIHRI